MAEFCTCGSLMIDGSCTNKNCVHRAVKGATTKRTRVKKESVESKPKATRTRKASKCITYNLYETAEEDSK